MTPNPAPILSSHYRPDRNRMGRGFQRGRGTRPLPFCCDGACRILEHEYGDPSPTTYTGTQDAQPGRGEQTSSIASKNPYRSWDGTTEKGGHGRWVMGLHRRIRILGRRKPSHEVMSSLVREMAAGSWESLRLLRRCRPQTIAARSRCGEKSSCRCSIPLALEGRLRGINQNRARCRSRSGRTSRVGQEMDSMEECRPGRGSLFARCAVTGNKRKRMLTRTWPRARHPLP